VGGGANKSGNRDAGVEVDQQSPVPWYGPLLENGELALDMLAVNAKWGVSGTLRDSDLIEEYGARGGTLKKRQTQLNNRLRMLGKHKASALALSGGGAGGDGLQQGG
ncbi:unnamed protein product, partial [Amoebophrya sp. A120]